MRLLSLLFCDVCVAVGLACRMVCVRDRPLLVCTVTLSDSRYNILSLPIATALSLAAGRYQTKSRLRLYDWLVTLNSVPRECLQLPVREPPPPMEQNRLEGTRSDSL